MDQIQSALRQGRQAEKSAKNDAKGELYCQVCGLKRFGKDVCPECGADREDRVDASNDNSFPKSLEEARKYVKNR